MRTEIKIRYRKHRKTVVRRYSAYDFDAEPGDLMVNGYYGMLYRLEDRRVGNLAALGELYPRLIKPPQKGLKAVIEGDDVYWVDEDTFKNHG